MIIKVEVKDKKPKKKIEIPIFSTFEEENQKIIIHKKILFP